MNDINVQQLNITMDDKQDYLNLLREINKGNINNQIDYNDYNKLNDLLNIQLENWGKMQDDINKITKIKSTLINKK